MNWKIALFAPLLSCACLPSPESTPSSTDTSGSPSTPPAPVALRTITLTAGPAWDPALPPEAQDLADHLAWAQGSFSAGALLAYGPYLDDGRGWYLYLDQTAPETDALLADDPGLASGVLALDGEGRWDLLFEALGAPTADPLFVLDATPGPAWVTGLPLTEQDLADHLSYTSTLFADGRLLAGGPVSEEAGRYVVAAPDASAADALVADDPGVTSGVLSVAIRPWGPFARQSVADALASAGMTP